MEDQDKAEALKRRVRAERASSPGVWAQYSDQLKRDVLALALTPGWSVARVSRAVGLASSVVQRWSRKAAVRVEETNLRQVEVVADSGIESRTFELEFASGARIVGLTWSEVTSLVRGGR